MRKIILPVCVVILMISAAGCVSKAEHDKVLSDKNGLEQALAQLTQEKEQLEAQLSMIQQDFERFTQENTRLMDENSMLSQDREETLRRMNDAMMEADRLREELNRLNAQSQSVPQE
jgi:outer membrane murein-binding lipoprotein Lpp